MYVYIRPYFTERDPITGKPNGRKIYDDCYTVGFYKPDGGTRIS